MGDRTRHGTINWTIETLILIFRITGWENRNFPNFLENCNHENTALEFGSDRNKKMDHFRMPAAWYGSEVGFHAFIPIVPTENPTISRPRSKIEKLSSYDRKWPTTFDLEVRLGSNMTKLGKAWNCVESPRKRIF